MSFSKISRRAVLLGVAGAGVTTAAYALRNQAGRARAQLREWLSRSPTSVSLGTFQTNNPDSFDVCIIGSGPAGAVLGKDLVDQGLRTVMLESGPNLATTTPSVNLQKLEVYRSSGEVEYPVIATRMRAVGGTSNLWTGRCTRLYPLDFEENAYTPPGAAWPIHYDELEPYYAQAEKTLQVRGNNASNFYPPRSTEWPLRLQEDLAELQSLLQPTGVRVDEAPTSSAGLLKGGPIRATSDLLPDFTESAYATLLSDVTATKLVADATGYIRGVEVQTLGGEKKTIQAHRYIVACGAIESARLLLLSRSPEFPNGIGNQYDQVGRSFMEHPALMFRGEISPPQKPSQFQLGLSLQFYEEFKRQGLGSITLVFYWNPNSPALVKISLGFEMYPAPANRVSLAADLQDYFGNAAADLALSLTEHDQKTIEAGKRLIERIYADLGAKKVMQEEGIHWSHHHMGTCRMGDNPTTSVVDRNLRVHDSPNLYVAGSATFVTSGAAHPTLAITALSHRLAKHLVATQHEIA